VPFELFEVVGPIGGIETIASGHGIRDLGELQERFGRASWRKLKGFATVRLDDVRLLRRRFTGTRLTASANAG
jgi:hypothetical protein